jgi:hypothetical protein
MENFDSVAFESTVLDAVSVLQYYNKQDIPNSNVAQDIILSFKHASMNSLHDYSLLRKLLEIESRETKGVNRVVLVTETATTLEKEAKAITARKDIRQALCPALKSASNDAFEIAKITTPILVPLALVGTIAIPLNPLLFAIIALVIARMGIASLCADFDKKDKEK